MEVEAGDEGQGEGGGGEGRLVLSFLGTLQNLASASLSSLAMQRMPIVVCSSTSCEFALKSN